MKKKLFCSIGIISMSLLFKSQVGVNNANPKATLDVSSGDVTNTEKPEGVIAPRLTGDQLKAKDNSYQGEQTGCLVYVTEAVSNASPKTINVTMPGYYYFDGVTWGRFYTNGKSSELAAYKQGNFSLLNAGGAGWKKVNIGTSDVTIGNGSLLTDGTYTIPEPGVYFINYEMQVKGVNIGLLGENQLALLKNNNVIEKKDLDAVSLSILGINLTNIPITSTNLISLKAFNSGDQLTFAMKNDGLSLGLLSNSIVAVSIYKISH